MSTRSSTSTIHHAPAKIILAGEHAVVYGQPALAIPVQGLRASATVSRTEQPLQIVARDLNNQFIEFSDDQNPLALAARKTLAFYNQTTLTGRIEVQSEIPIASGLGSGAAIATVIVRAVHTLLDKPTSPDVINHIVYEVEKFHHGTPSGIDNTVVVFEKPIFFMRDYPIEIIEARQDLYFVIADTGITAPTKASVADVRTLYEQRPDEIKPLIEAIGDLSRQSRAAIEQGQTGELGRLLVENHKHLQALTVSSDELDHLVNVALNAGALGAKLSGGGRGGNMIALTHPTEQETIMRALQAAGAVRVRATRLDATTQPTQDAS